MSAQPTSMTAATQVLTGKGALVSVCLCGGADAATCTVYDGVGATGTILAKLGVAAGLSATYTPAIPSEVDAGIYVALTGTTPTITVSHL